MKQFKNVKTVYYILLVTLLELLAISSFVSKAQAGAGRQPLTPITTPEPMPKRPSTPLPPESATLSSSAKPLNWENPYWVNNMICRESQGNIVCLSPEEAKKLRWFLPTNN
jgi:hypothetical protein